MGELKGVERVQNVSHVSDLDDWIMVPLNETGDTGDGKHLSGKMMQIRYRTQTLAKVN